MHKAGASVYFGYINRNNCQREVTLQELLKLNICCSVPCYMFSSSSSIMQAFCLFLAIGHHAHPSIRLQKAKLKLELLVFGTKIGKIDQIHETCITGIAHARCQLERKWRRLEENVVQFQKA